MKIISISAYRYMHYKKPREPDRKEYYSVGRTEETEEERVERIWQNILAEMRRIKGEEQDKGEN